jgi:hypothetical protein
MKLTPNMELVHPDIHLEVANKKLDENDDKHILSKVRAYKGTVYRAKDVAAVDHFHTLSPKSDNIPGFTQVGHARFVILNSGDYKPQKGGQKISEKDTKHIFHNLEFEGSFSVGKVHYVVQTIPQFRNQMEQPANETSHAALLAPPEERAPHHRASKMIITRAEETQANRKGAGCASSDISPITNFKSMSWSKREYHFSKRQAAHSNVTSCNLSKTAKVVSLT